MNFSTGSSPLSISSSLVCSSLTVSNNLLIFKPRPEVLTSVSTVNNSGVVSIS